MKTIKTIWSNLVESHKLFNSPIYLPNFVTLNEKYNIPSIDNDVTKMTLGYYSIGLRINGVGVNDIHNSSDREVFKPVPFLMVPTSTGLTQSQIDTYKIRVTRIINNVEYILCYLKKVTAIVNDNVAYSVDYNKNNGHFSPVEYVPPQAYTSPPISVSCNGSGVSKFYAVSSKIRMNLSVNEIASINTAADLLYGVTVPPLHEVCVYAGIEDSNSELSLATPYLFKAIESNNFDATGKMSLTINIGGMTPV